MPSITDGAGCKAVIDGKATGVDELILYDEAPGTAYEDYESVDGLAKVPEITDGAGCKAVIDGIGKATLDMSLGSLAQRGIFVSFGNASGAVPAYPPLRHIAKSSFMCRPKLLDYTRNREELLYRSNRRPRATSTSRAARRRARCCTASTEWRTLAR